MALNIFLTYSKHAPQHSLIIFPNLTLNIREHIPQLDPKKTFKTILKPKTTFKADCICNPKPSTLLACYRAHIVQSQQWSCYSGPRDPYHVPFCPCVHQPSLLGVVDLNSFCDLPQHRVVFERSSNVHLELLYLPVMYLKTMSP